LFVGVVEIVPVSRKYALTGVGVLGNSSMLIDVECEGDDNVGVGMCVLLLIVTFEAPK